MADVRVTPRPWLWKPRTKPVRFIEIHATRGNTTPALQKSAALNWVQSDSNNQGGWGSSFSYAIGTDGSQGTVLDDDQMPTYSAGYGGPGSTYAIDEYGISYELAQSAAQEPFTDACLQRAAKEVAAKCEKYDIPVVFLTIPSQSGTVPTGLVRHDRCQNGYVLGKTDPGAQFSESRFLTLVKGEMMDDARVIQLINKHVPYVRFKPTGHPGAALKTWMSSYHKHRLGYGGKGRNHIDTPAFVRKVGSGTVYMAVGGALFHIPTSAVRKEMYKLYGTGKTKALAATNPIWKLPRFSIS